MPAAVPLADRDTQTHQALQQRLGYRFSDIALLRQALTHRSYGRPHNERLEFLGDAILNCVMAALLFARYEQIDEGDLSRVRANLVRQRALHEIAERLELGEDLLLGEGEQRSGGRQRPSILADTVEALVGAIYLDGGFGAAQRVIQALYRPSLQGVDPRTLGKDAKTRLQEYLQGRRLALPTYTVLATHGEAHAQTFDVQCEIARLHLRVSASGSSRRAAEQEAARLALEAVQVRSRQSSGQSGTVPASPGANPAPGDASACEIADGGRAQLVVGGPAADADD